jgi:hypothetical protein
MSVEYGYCYVCDGPLDVLPADCDDHLCLSCQKDTLDNPAEITPEELKHCRRGSEQDDMNDYWK